MMVDINVMIEWVSNGTSIMGYIYIYSGEHIQHIPKKPGRASRRLGSDTIRGMIPQSFTNSNLHD